MDRPWETEAWERLRARLGLAKPVRNLLHIQSTSAAGPWASPLPAPHPVLWHGFELGRHVKLHSCRSCAFYSTSLEALAAHAIRVHNWPEDLGDLVP